MFRKFLDGGVEWLCSLLLAIITVDLLLGVFSRYVLERTFVWYDEVARACFIWLVFLGAAAAVKRGAHFGLHMFVELMPPPLKRAALLLTPLTVIVFSAAIASRWTRSCCWRSRCSSSPACSWKPAASQYGWCTSRRRSSAGSAAAWRWRW